MPNVSWTSIKTLSMHTVGRHGLSNPFGGSNEPRSEYTPHLDDFRVLWHTIFWVIRIPRSKMPNVFVDVRQDLVYAYSWPHGLSGPFGGSNDPRSEHTPHFNDFRVLQHTIFWVIRIPTSKMPNVFMDIHQDLVYAYGCPSRLVLPIWRVKRAPKRSYASFRRFSCAIAHHFLGDPDSDVKNAKFFRGRRSRPCLCIWLAITACPTHF